MLLVTTTIAQSPIPGAGLGLFADQDIPRDFVLWRFHPLFDICVNADQLLSLPEPLLGHIYHYAYFFEPWQTFIFCGDDARFMNHQDQPNCLDLPPDPNGYHGDIIAHRDIQRGEELTCDYRRADCEVDFSYWPSSLIDALLTRSFYGYWPSREKPESKGLWQAQPLFKNKLKRI